MFTKKHYINVVSLLLLSVVTFINFYKLTLLYVEIPFLISLLYVAAFLSFFFIADKKSNKNKSVGIGHHVEGIRQYFPTLLSVYVLLPYLLLTYFTSNMNPEGRWVETEILIFVVLASAVIIMGTNYLDGKKFNISFFIFPILFGLILSANFYFGFVLILAILFIFRESFPKIFLFSLITFAFGIIIPKFLNAVHFTFDYEIFFPQIPVWLIIILLLITIYVGWMIADLQELFFSSGIILFIYLLIPSISKIIQLGFYRAVNNELEFSSLLVVVPIFLFAIKEYEVEKFLGKVYKDAE